VVACHRPDTLDEALAIRAARDAVGALIHQQGEGA
jgi:hypothetical protein